MFGVSGRSWVALGDPIGLSKDIEDLAWTLRERADRAGGRVAFYHTQPEYLPLYLDMGLIPLKLGEEAIVLLDEFGLDGTRRKSLRQSFHRAEREGLSFEIWDRATVAARLDDLGAISESWLTSKNTREKGFSLGRFDSAYIRRFEAAIARLDGRAVAFANIMTTDTKSKASIDLMRHLPDAPPSTMLFLFVHLLLYFKAQGLRRFTLGMAPLSGLETHPLAPLWHRFGDLVYNRGERFYNFQGLREFKEKFNPIWEPRYLATTPGLSPILVMADIAALIGGGMQGIFRK
jgi:phosphatidylglycerol lysyltransferase